MQLTGAEIVVECLKEQGVDTVFGYPGGAILNVYDELYKHSNEIRAYPYLPRAGSRPRGGRVCQGHRQVGRLPLPRAARVRPTW